MEVSALYQEALKRGVCARFTGRETIGELCALLATPQGLEFCAKNQWPTIEVFRAFRGTEAEAAGVYVDAGFVTLYNPKSAVLIGDTRARLTYDDPTPDLHQVAVLYGASAQIEASNWSVVACHNLGGTIRKHTQDFAVVR